MSSLNKISFSEIFISYFPIAILFLSVFNEFDFNYLKIEYFSFNFVFILIFYWTLRNPDRLGYISIFLAGLINDVVVGVPIGISSFCYLIICTVTAWALPSFGVKRDAVPGRINETWFKAEKVGTYYGQCSELCGIKHAFMPITVKVVSEED